MGLFDDIRFETKCPVCKSKVTGFQSKDGQCYLEMLDYWEVDRFYSTCQKCQTWIEYNRKRPAGKIPIKDYKRSHGKR